MFGTLLTIVLVVLGIVISIALHELGHMLPAKLFKVPVSEYFIGFGPTLWSKKFGETVYGFKAILLGGYTKITGMFPQKPEGHTDKYFAKLIGEVRVEALTDVTPENEPRAFYNLTFGKKLLVMAGGTLTNLVLGFLCFVISFTLIGGSQPTTTIGKVTKCETAMRDPKITDKCENLLAPAYKAGLNTGSEIIAVNHEEVSSWDEIFNAISTAPFPDITLTIRKQNSEANNALDPSQNADPNADPNAGLDNPTDPTIEDPNSTISPDDSYDISINAIKINGQYKIGVAPEYVSKKLSFGESTALTGSAIWQTVKAVGGIPVTLFTTVKNMITGEPRAGGLVSIVGVGQIAVAGEKASTTFAERITTFLSIMGSLNIGLFVLNLIPLLPLDGGHSANAIYEGCKRGLYRIRKKPRPGPSDLARSMPVAYVVYGLLILMSIILVIADIVSPVV
jgi:membrane-associated protease RseP (regulator of RpoE activity)